MNKFLFICLLLFSNSFLFGQGNDTIPPTHRNEWGINITGFATQFFSFNGNEVDEGSYLFTYKNIKGARALRLGLGFFVNHTNSEGGNNIAPLITNGFDIDFRIGLEKQFPIARRWLFTAGGDFLIGYKDITSRSESNFGTVEIKEEEFSAGIGPVLGVHFRFNQRVSIGTEGTVYLRYFNAKNSTDFGNGGGTDTNKSDGVNFAMVTPLALYFAVRI